MPIHFIAKSPTPQQILSLPSMQTERIAMSKTLSPTSNGKDGQESMRTIVRSLSVNDAKKGQLECKVALVQHYSLYKIKSRTETNEILWIFGVNTANAVRITKRIA
jgi:hypothetical protein